MFPVAEQLVSDEISCQWTAILIPFFIPSFPGTDLVWPLGALADGTCNVGATDSVVQVTTLPLLNSCINCHRLAFICYCSQQQLGTICR